MAFAEKPDKTKKPEREIIGSATVKADLVNVRKNPSLNAQILKEVKKGEKFNVTTGGTSQFTALIVDDTVAYIMTELLDVIKN